MDKKFTLRAIVMISIVSTIIGIGLTPIQSFSVLLEGEEQASRRCPCPKAPIATSGNNIYIAWWSNKSSNDEVMFKASTDGGKTFGSKLNLSNTPNSDSQDVQIAADGNNVYVTWWERNQTMNEPVMRISTDNGQTFSPLLKLAANGTIGTGE